MVVLTSIYHEKEHKGFVIEEEKRHNICCGRFGEICYHA